MPQEVGCFEFYRGGVCVLTFREHADLKVSINIHGQLNYGYEAPCQILVMANNFYHPNVDMDTKEIKIPLQKEPSDQQTK